MLCITANLGDAVDGAARAQFVGVADRVAGVVSDHEAEFAAMRGPWSTASRRPDRFGTRRSRSVGRQPGHGRTQSQHHQAHRRLLQHDEAAHGPGLPDSQRGPRGLPSSGLKAQTTMSEKRGADQIPAAWRVRSAAVWAGVAVPRFPVDRQVDAS